MCKKLINYFVIILFCFICSVGNAFADTEEAGYTTQIYDVNVEITENYVFHFTETISVDFEEERHGIYRYISKDESAYEIKNIQVKEHEYEVYDKEECFIEMGNPDVLIKGRQVYSFSYDIVGFKDRNPKGDVLYLDVLPTNWATPIDVANIVVHFPSSFNLDNFQVHAGNYGVSGENEEIDYEFSDDGLTLTIKADGLKQGTGITISTELPEGYWVNPKEHDWPMYVVIGLLFIGIVISAYNWFRYGRDKNPTKVVEFYPPNGMTPAELGYFVEGISTNGHISSMILYFADKGYLTINENGTNHFELCRKVKKLPENEEIYARILFYGLFRYADKVSLSHLPDGIAKIYQKAESQLAKAFEKKEKLFTDESSCKHIIMWTYYMAVNIIPCILLAFFGANTFIVEGFLDGVAFSLFLGVCVFFSSAEFMNIYDSWYTSGVKGRIITAIIAIGSLVISFSMNLYIAYANFGSVSYCVAFVVLSIIMIIFITVMRARTEDSTLLLGRVLGFREFIETAEVDRLRMLSEENPEYFFSIMPYAYVFGLSDKWTERFVNQISVNAPSWYSGNCINSNDMFWYNSIGSRCMDSIVYNTEMKIFDELEVERESESSNSKLGRFFSGGGFGGGGGGSW